MTRARWATARSAWPSLGGVCPADLVVAALRLEQRLTTQAQSPRQDITGAGGQIDGLGCHGVTGGQVTKATVGKRGHIQGERQWSERSLDPEPMHQRIEQGARFRPSADPDHAQCGEDHPVDLDVGRADPLGQLSNPVKPAPSLL